MGEQDWPEILQETAEMFAEEDARTRLELLLEYGYRLPELPEELHQARDQMERVDECQSPVFVRARCQNGVIYYDIDVPQEAPTARGFAGVLYEGLNGATPQAIEAVPDDLPARMGLVEALTHQRLRGLTAVLARIKRLAREQAQAAGLGPS